MATLIGAFLSLSDNLSEMVRADTQFTGSIPETYERYLAPLFFAPYAADLARRARVLGPGRALEIAAGTGIVTRALAAALPEADIIATDLNRAMLSFAVAASRCAAPRLRWSAADALELPFADGSFDLAACQFGVMFFPDRVRAFREARRVLSPGGEYLFSVWDDVQHNDVARVVAEALATVFPEDPPLFVQRVPHGHGDCAAIEADLRRSGFNRIAWETVDQRSHADSARAAAIGVCEGTPLRHVIVTRGPQRLRDVVDAATRALEAKYGDGAIDAAMRAFVFTAASEPAAAT
jgi:SAM-dependent methyltransferase